MKYQHTAKNAALGLPESYDERLAKAKAKAEKAQARREKRDAKKAKEVEANETLSVIDDAPVVQSAINGVQFQRFYSIPTPFYYSSGIGQLLAAKSNDEDKVKDRLDSLKSVSQIPTREIVREVPQARAEAPDIIGTITAYRAWALNKVNGEWWLTGLGQKDQLWIPRRAMKAQCHKSIMITSFASYTFSYSTTNWSTTTPSASNPLGVSTAIPEKPVEPEPHGETPKADCTCGFWGFKTMEEFANCAVSYNYVVCGIVDMWGKVIETEHGYRAEYCYPRELWIMDSTYEELGATYGVPVRVIPTPNLPEGVEFA